MIRNGRYSSIAKELLYSHGISWVLFLFFQDHASHVFGEIFIVIFVDANA